MCFSSHCTAVDSNVASSRQLIGLPPTPQAWRSLGHSVPTLHLLKQPREIGFICGSGQTVTPTVYTSYNKY